MTGPASVQDLGFALLPFMPRLVPHRPAARRDRAADGQRGGWSSRVILVANAPIAGSRPRRTGSSASSSRRRCRRWGDAPAAPGGVSVGASGGPRHVLAPTGVARAARPPQAGDPERTTGAGIRDQPIPDQLGASTLRPSMLAISAVCLGFTWWDLTHSGWWSGS